MQQAVVKSLPAEDNLQIELMVGGKQRYMDRPKTELLERTLARIQKNAAPLPGELALLPVLLVTLLLSFSCVSPSSMSFSMHDILYVKKRLSINLQMCTTSSVKINLA